MHPGRSERSRPVRPAPVGTAETDRPTSRWARGIRPLRRSEGVPGPLETPGFVHRAALDTVRSRNRALATTLVVLVGAASILAVTLRTLFLS